MTTNRGLKLGINTVYKPFHFSEHVVAVSNELIAIRFLVQWCNTEF